MLGQFSELIFALRNRHLFLADAAIMLLSPPVALWLRTDVWGVASPFFAALGLYTLTACIVRFVAFRRFGLYARFWRYASVDELVQIAFALFVTTTLLTVIFWWLVPLVGILGQSVPRSVPLVDGLLVFVGTSGTRFSIRFAERMRQPRASAQKKSERVAIFGAGDAGIAIVREMQRNPRLGLEPVVFIDADPLKQGNLILGVPVVGDRSILPQVVKTYDIQQAIIAIPSAPGKTIRDLTHLCQEINLPVKTMPGMSELLDGRVRVNQLRLVEIADLLRREPVETDLGEIAGLLQGKRVLVTGAGGSIGSELCRQIARCAPAEMILLGHGENSIFEILGELQSNHVHASMTCYHPLIADVRDRNRLRHVFSRYRPEIVFHAAAHKHVPLMEENLEDAVTTNVLGTRNVLAYVAETQVEHFVLISTDKAVNPTSVMGATKRVAELMVQAMARRTGRQFVAVRFGNVLDSRGSVVPLFKKQIARGGPVLVTHPEMRRYFMTIPEAVQLVLQTTVFGASGEVYVLDMGEPVRIVDLARDLIRLSGYDEDEIEIQFTGLRPGEKLFEELFLSEENYRRTTHSKIFVAQNGVHSSVCDPETELMACVDLLVVSAQSEDTTRTRELLQAIVPEYHPPGASLPND
ncbi:O-antigen biosynthesis protein WbqV [Anaerolineae bacterium]|nr:O-antigen biosynthesis protein WbqV [Anaerolineae bacterium]